MDTEKTISVPILAGYRTDRFRDQGVLLTLTLVGLNQQGTPAMAPRLHPVGMSAAYAVELGEALIAAGRSAPNGRVSLRTA